MTDRLLTDEEIDCLWTEMNIPTRCDFARRIEALVRKRLAEKIRHAANVCSNDYGLSAEAAARIVESDDER